MGLFDWFKKKHIKNDEAGAKNTESTVERLEDPDQYSSECQQEPAKKCEEPKKESDTKNPTPNPAIRSGPCGSNLQWELDAEGTLTISGSGPMANIKVKKTRVIDEDQAMFESMYGDWTLSEGDVDTYFVLPWGNECNIRKAIIQRGVTSIDSGAFSTFRLEWCGSVLIGKYESLTEIVLSDTVEILNPLSISDCPNLTKVFVPESVTQIHSYVFSGCPKLTIWTPAGSYAEQYARENNIPVRLVKNMDEYLHPIPENKLTH